MTIAEFEQFLEKKKPNKLYFLKHLTTFESFLQSATGKSSIDEAAPKDIDNFVADRMKKGKIIRFAGLEEYFVFRKKSELTKVVRQAQKTLRTEPWWINNLAEALDERVGEDLRRDIFQGRENLKQTSSASKKIEFSRDVIDRMERTINDEVCKDALSCGLHKRRTRTDKLRREFKRVGDLDIFLATKQAEVLQKYSEKGEDYQQFIKEHPDCEFGVREGDVISICKIPHQVEQYSKTSDEHQKRYHYCHCGFAKESLKNENIDISPMFCYCGAGWYRQLWEGIFAQPVKVDVVESVLDKSNICRFVVHIPSDIMEFYVHK